LPCRATRSTPLDERRRKMSPRAASVEQVEIGDFEVTVTNPAKVLFPKTGTTKLDVVRYYLAVADGALRHAGDRPNVLVRYPNGIDEPYFFQKRMSTSRPPWIEVVTIAFPSGRSADEIVPRSAASLAWMANLGCIELHPHPVRADDLEHPDELRVDLDPVPGVRWTQIREVALVVREVLADTGLVGWPKTSGSRGMHVNVRLVRDWGFDDVRRAALALAREVERRAPTIASSKWWKEERHGVFLDYNQNAKDRTVASAYSIRPRPDARVSAPLDWEEITDCDPEDFTIATMPQRFARIGDRHAAMNTQQGRLDLLLELADRQAAEGLGDAPWPPHHARRAAEPTRAPPSKRRAGAIAGKAKPAPLVEIGRSWTKRDAMRGLGRWKKRHPEVAALLEPADVLVDSMRGKYSVWTRVRVNLSNVPPDLRPAQEPLDPEEDVSTGRPPPRTARRTPSRARKAS
jgi:bifunctional non-homologous end joining protein LigD